MITIRCNGCGASVTTADGSDPDGALACGCCPQDHHHSGECRPLTITIGQVTVN